MSHESLNTSEPETLETRSQRAVAAAVKVRNKFWKTENIDYAFKLGKYMFFRSPALILAAVLIDAIWYEWSNFSSALEYLTQPTPEFFIMDELRKDLAAMDLPYSDDIPNRIEEGFVRGPTSFFSVFYPDGTEGTYRVQIDPNNPNGEQVTITEVDDKAWGVGPVLRTSEEGPGGWFANGGENGGDEKSGSISEDTYERATKALKGEGWRPYDPAKDSGNEAVKALIKRQIEPYFHQKDISPLEKGFGIPNFFTNDPKDYLLWVEGRLDESMRDTQNAVLESGAFRPYKESGNVTYKIWIDVKGNPHFVPCPPSMIEGPTENDKGMWKIPIRK